MRAGGWRRAKKEEKMESLQAEGGQGNPGGWIPAGVFKKSSGPEERPGPGVMRTAPWRFTRATDARRSQTL